MFPRARHGLVVNSALCRAKCATLRRNISLRAVQTDVPLALLLRIVEGMRVQEGPHKLPADIFQAKFEMRMLINGVMPAKVGRRADHHPLLIGDFFWADQTRRIAGARRRYRRIECVREMIAQSDARRSCFHLRTEWSVG